MCEVFTHVLTTYGMNQVMDADDIRACIRNHIAMRQKVKSVIQTYCPGFAGTYPLVITTIIFEERNS